LVYERGRLKNFTLIHKPTTTLCIWRDFENQKILRTNHSPKYTTTNTYTQFSAYYTYQPKTYQHQKSFHTYNYQPQTPSKY